MTDKRRTYKSGNSLCTKWWTICNKSCSTF